MWRWHPDLLAEEAFLSSARCLSHHSGVCIQGGESDFGIDGMFCLHTFCYLEKARLTFAFALLAGVCSASGSGLEGKLQEGKSACFLPRFSRFRGIPQMKRRAGRTARRSTLTLAASRG